MRERRRFVRVPEHLQVSYRILPGTKMREYITKNISQGGMRFYVHELIPEGSILEIRLTLQKIFFSFKSRVKVVWSKEEPRSERYEVGVKFINIPQKAADNLLDYIRNVSRENRRRG